ncbi:MAG TPA: hypothetical protein VF585_03975, partial [Chthoniobacterales bacterium]
PPLDEIIALLNKEADRSRREYSVVVRNPAEAPPIYRSSVADYFEQLSKDYEGAPPEPAAPEEKP